MVRSCPIISSAVYRFRAMLPPFAGRNLNSRTGLVYRGRSMMQNFLREMRERLHHHAQRRFDDLQHLSSGIEVVDLIGATGAEHERGTAILFARLTNQTIVLPFRDQLVASCPIFRLFT